MIGVAMAMGMASCVASRGSQMKSLTSEVKCECCPLRRILPQCTGMRVVNGRNFFHSKFSLSYLNVKGGCISSFQSLDRSFQWKVMSSSQIAPEPSRRVIVDETYAILAYHFTSIFWDVGRFLVIPFFIISALIEVISTVAVSKELLIPLGLLAGIVSAGVLKETAAELTDGVKEGTFPWQFLVIGAIFALVKLMGAYCSGWPRAFIPHLANGGLWQTLFEMKDWCKRQSSS